MEPNQTVYTVPFGTYFVAYPGTLAIGEVLTIPNRHRREGDVDDNPQVRVIVQNVYNTPGSTNENVIEIFDNSNTSCAHIFITVAWQLETSATLKMAMIHTATGTDPQPFRCIVFYKKP